MAFLKIAGVEKATLVLYDAVDVMQLPVEELPVKVILPLSPSARSLILDRGGRDREVVKLDSFDDDDYSRLMLLLEKEIQKKNDVVHQYNELSKAGEFALSYGFNAIAISSLRLWRVLGEHGPWVIPVDGEWLLTNNKEEAHIKLLGHIAKNYKNVVSTYPYNPPHFPIFFKFLRNITLSLMRKANVSVVTQRSSHPLGLSKKLEAASPTVRQYLVAQCVDGFKDYLRLPRELYRSWRGHFQVQIKTIIKKNNIGEAIVDSLLEQLDDPSIISGLRQMYLPIVEAINLSHGAVDDMAYVVQKMHPSAFVSYELANGFTAALAEGSLTIGIPRIVANHNANSPVDTEYAAIAVREIFCAQHAPNLVNLAFFWTPPALEAAKNIFSKSLFHQVLPIRRPIEEKKPINPLHQSTQRVILHAGNAQRWFAVFPWVYETTDEYFDGLLDLVASLKEIENTTLVIRSKLRRVELGQSILERHFPQNEKIKLRTRHSAPFEEDLAMADLVIAVFSTTIMQALHTRKPVLLWGGTKRYEYLPARRTFPTREDRAAVYTVDRVKDLGPMIEAILDAHAGIPLTDEELEGLVWSASADIPTVSELAQAIADGDILRPWRDRGMVSSSVL